VLYKNFASQYRLNGKERDWETGNFYYGARYEVYPERRFGDPKISVWLSVDPLAMKDPFMTSYHFVYNNPIMFVDPHGLHGYRVDSLGNISSEPVDDTGGKDYDVLYNHDMSKKSLPIEPGVLNSANRESESGSDEDGAYVIDVLDVSKMNNPLALFEFLAKETKVEWSMVTMDHSQNTDRVWLTTTHRDNHELGAGQIMDREWENYNLKEHIHSHPGEIYAMPSPGDITSAEKLEIMFITPILRIYLPETDKYKRYNSKSPSFIFPEATIIINKK